MSGYLLIGVTDSGDVVGIEEDCSSRDGFARMLDDLVSSRLTAGTGQRLRTRFFEIEPGRTVALVDCRRSVEPVFLKGQENRQDLFVRVGNTTREIVGPELVDLLRTRFRGASPGGDRG